MTSGVLTAFPADGFSAAWSTCEGGFYERLGLTWDNEAWTATVQLELERVEFVVRLSPLWQVRQVLLFRDLDEPDLWLGTDGHGRWGEINGVQRNELDGAADVAFVSDDGLCSVFAHTIPIRRLPVDIGGSFDARTIELHVDTLSLTPALHTYRRTGADAWEVARDGATTELRVDRYGLPTEVSNTARRVG